MTREEAKTILEEVKMLDDSMYQYNPIYLKALDVAISALSVPEKEKHYCKNCMFFNTVDIRNCVYVCGLKGGTVHGCECCEEWKCSAVPKREKETPEEDGTDLIAEVVLMFIKHIRPDGDLSYFSYEEIGRLHEIRDSIREGGK